MLVNWKRREINLNIVYYGPALSGKTTNLEQIHSQTNTTTRSELFTLNTHEDRTIYFDFLQLEMGEISGLRPKFGLYTVPGQVYYEATRELVLRRASGCVFVADSQDTRLAENIMAWQDMERHLAKMGHTTATFPLILQLNKRDLPGALPVTTLKNTLLGDAALPCYEASALQGTGVRETLGAIMRLTLLSARKQLVIQKKVQGA